MRRSDWPSFRVAGTGAGGLESFPSGHVQWAASFYGLMAYVMLGTARTGRMHFAIAATYALIVVLTMFGRIELGRHWLTEAGSRLGGIFSRPSLR